MYMETWAAYTNFKEKNLRKENICVQWKTQASETEIFGAFRYGEEK
jgi:hypothetical protein